MNCFKAFKQKVLYFPFYINYAAMADEAAAIMATNDTRIFFMVGSPVFTYPNNQWLITEKAVDLRAG